MRNEMTPMFRSTIVGFVIALLVSGQCALAETASLSKRDQLRGTPDIGAGSLAPLAAGSRVEVLEVRGAWVRIKVETGEGWVRATSLKRQGVKGPPVAAVALASGRHAVTTPSASLGIRGVPPGGGATHALILTISKYQGGIPELPGVRFDAAKATEIARAMGVDASNIRYLKDEEVTADGIDLALSRLYERINPGDQVFIYYSGHGGRVVVLDPEPRCAEALVSVTGDAYVDSKLDARLKRLAQKAGKIIAFFDACHSGGVATRAVKAGKGELRPKSWTKGDTEACVKPVNVITRSLAKPSIPGSGAGNYVYIAAARDNEVALDHPSKGGIATSAWGACIAGAAGDRDGSGGLSAAEIQECAQQKIDDAIRESKNVLPHHVTVTGNANTVLAFPRHASTPVAPPALASMPAADTPPVAQGSQAVEAFPAKPTASSPAVAGSSPPENPRGPAATLNDLYANRDDRRLVEVVVARPVLKIGADKLSMSVSSADPGYVYVLMAGSDGSGFDLIFPNQLDQDNHIKSNTPLTFPRPGWELVAQGPVGTDRLLVLVSAAPRDFKTLPLRPTGPFSVIETSPANAKDIQLVFGGGSPAAPECKGGSAGRNLVVAQRCSGAYGAALVKVEEIQ